MKKRKHSKSKHKSKQFLGLNKALTFLILSFSLLVFLATIIIISYNFGIEEGQEKHETIVYKTKEENKLLRQRLQQTLKKDHCDSVVEKDQYTKHRIRERLKQLPSIVQKKAVKTLKPEPHYKNLKTIKTVCKPKLAIILDDVSFASEVRHVKALGLKVNFSFFPPTPRHPQTARLASREPFYMVHLPLEAMNFTSEEPRTLHVNDSFKMMKDRLKDIKKDFPRLKYVNNHTGSKFTSDYNAVRKLFKAARSLDLDIIDSRTIASTQLPQVYEDAHRSLLFRDVFLDHKADVSYICGQMKEAVNRAIQQGKAIAIGHPRRNTIKALKACKSYFDLVELVYVTEL